MTEVFAVVGIDDAMVMIGIGTAGLLFRARQKRVKAKFLERNLGQISKENATIADQWRAEKPREKKLVVDRAFKPAAFLAPTVRVKQAFKRDPRPWYKRWFS